MVNCRFLLQEVPSTGVKPPDGCHALRIRSHIGWDHWQTLGRSITLLRGSIGHDRLGAIGQMLTSFLGAANDPPACIDDSGSPIIDDDNRITGTLGHELPCSTAPASVLGAEASGCIHCSTRRFNRRLGAAIPIGIYRNDRVTHPAAPGVVARSIRFGYRCSRRLRSIRVRVRRPRRHCPNCCGCR
jgi:hypothetical protein